MADPIRVLHVIGKMDRGGAETMLMNLYRQIDRSKVQFDFVVHTLETGAFDEEITSLGGNIYRLPVYRGSNHMQYRKSWVSFFKNHPQYRVIHAHLTTTAAIFLPIAKRYGLITIAHSHNNTPSNKSLTALIKNGMRYPLRYMADYFFACSYAAGVRLSGKNFPQKENCFVFPNAFNVDEFAYDDSIRSNKRRELSLQNKFVVGHVGRFALVKNHPFLIDVFKEIHKQDEDAVLLLVGDGKQRQKMEQKVADLGLSESVLFLGIRQDIPQLLQAMDLFIFPSFYEGLPVSLVEAQASGLPCLVSDTVTDEIKLTPLVKQLSLKEGANFWAKVAMNGFEENKRKNKVAEIKAAGYSIKETTLWLQKFYVGMDNTSSGGQHKCLF